MSPHYRETAVQGASLFYENDRVEIRGCVPIAVGNGNYGGEAGHRVTVGTESITAYLLPVQARELAALLVLHADLASKETTEKHT